MMLAAITLFRFSGENMGEKGEIQLTLVLYFYLMSITFLPHEVCQERKRITRIKVVLIRTILLLVLLGGKTL